MSRTLPLHTCTTCGKETFCHYYGDHYECQECFEDRRPDLKESISRVEDHCHTGQISRKGYLKWVQKYENEKIEA